MRTFTIDRALHATAGTVVLGSLALGLWLHPGFHLITAFVGANLLQSAFTGWCPAMWIFGKLGLPEHASA